MNAFHRVACVVTEAAGSVWVFLVALLLVVAWAVTGPMFGWSAEHSLFINTVTTICTFLVVFLIQHTQNREARVTQVKLDELLRAVNQARTSMVKLEDSGDDELLNLEQEMRGVSGSV